MHIDDLVLVSIDDHVIEPAGLFDAHIPATFRDRAPRYIATDDLRGHWLYEGQPTGQPGLNAVASWPRDEWAMDPVGFPEMRPGTYDVDLRVQDMDANGILASMCFPTMAGFSGMSLAREGIDDALSRAVIAAYNDWHIDELAGRYPGRFIPCAIAPVRNPDDAAAEIRRVAAKGCRAVSLPEAPYGAGLPGYDDDYWDPVLEACSELGVVLCLHIGGALGLLTRSPGALADHLIVLAPQLTAVIATDLLLAGTFVRYPDLKVALSEGGIGWVPYLLDRMDRHLWNQRWTGVKIGRPGQTATDVFREHFLACFITDPSALRIRDRIGVDSLAWECDYPHSDSTWPHSPELLWDELQGAGCSDDEIHAITWQNAARHFDFDPFVAIPRERANVGALRDRARDVDISETSRREYQRRWQAGLTGNLAR